MLATDPPVIVSHLFNVSSDILWKAITDVDQMRVWFFDDIPSFEPRVGFETSFPVQAPSMVFTHVWKILEVIPQERIVYDWSYPETVGRGKVIFDLETTGATTMLTLTNITLEDWPQDLPEFKRESCEGGWNFLLKDRLNQFINSQIAAG